MRSEFEYDIQHVRQVDYLKNIVTTKSIFVCISVPVGIVVWRRLTCNEDLSLLIDPMRISLTLSFLESKTTAEALDKTKQKKIVILAILFVWPLNV